MNSISEAIHFGVPLVCLPIDFDQPGVAYRVCDELGFGKRLSKETCTAQSIKEAVSNVLNEIGFKERISRFAQISRKHNGVETSARLIDEFLKDKLCIEKLKN